MNDHAAQDWWRQAAVYQIYPRSFADANGDGIGDLAGIASRIPYLQGLGIDAVWLSPFYPSRLIDGGYDVDDYRNVDPRIGTLEQFDELVRLLHDADLRIIIDIVPNHTSSEHLWFKEALASAPGSDARVRYIFRDGIGPGNSLPPSDWTSNFTGSAWTRVPDGQFYLHFFAPQQPDLNWSHPGVRADFVHTLRFWSDRGVDGFRVDVAHGLTKELTVELPTQDELENSPWDGNHMLWDRDDVHEIYRHWRSVFNEYDPPKMAVAEAWVGPERRPLYASPEELGQAFNFDLLETNFDADEFYRVISFNTQLSVRSGSSSTWVLSNHDVIRHATRYGLPHLTHDGDKGDKEWLQYRGPEVDVIRGLRRARAATLLLLALPGSVYLYQGEELGLPEVREIGDADRQDPTFYRSKGSEVGRDGCRIPLPWSRDGESYGFGAGRGHLPSPAGFSELSVEAQNARPESTLRLYRSALALRRELQTKEQMTWQLTSHPGTLHFARPNGWHCFTNFSNIPVPAPVGRIMLRSAPTDDNWTAPNTTMWLQLPVTA